MRESMRKIWKFSSGRHRDLLAALGCSFLRSAFGVTQLLAILFAAEVLTGALPVQTGLLRIAVLTAVCILGNFVTSYFEQTCTMTVGFFMTGDKRVAAGGLLRRLPLGFFSSASTGKITALLTTTLAGVESAAVMVMVGIVSGLFSSLVLFAFMLVYNWRIGLLSGAGMVCYLLVVAWQMRVSRKNAPALQTAQSRLAESALTFLQGIRVTKAFSFARGDEQLKDAIRGSRDANLKLTGLSMPSQFAAGLTIAVFESLILLSSL